MRKQGDSTLDEATDASQTPSPDVAGRKLRLVYSRPHPELGSVIEGHRVGAVRSASASRRFRPSGATTREDWPTWLTGAAVWELAVLIAMFTVLLMVGRRKSAWS